MRPCKPDFAGEYSIDQLELLRVVEAIDHLERARKEIALAKAYADNPKNQKPITSNKAKTK